VCVCDESIDQNRNFHLSMGVNREL